MFENLTKPGKGGLGVVVGGEAKGFRRASVDKESGEARAAAGTIVYWGGDQYVKLPDDQAGLVDRLKDGVWLTAQGELRSFKDSSFAGNFRIVTIDGKPV
jgi:hypothetical protein